MLALSPGRWRGVHSVHGMNWRSESALPQIKIWVNGSKSTHADEILGCRGLMKRALRAHPFRTTRIGPARWMIASSRSRQANHLGRRSAAMTRIWDRNSTNGLLRRATLSRAISIAYRRLPCWCDHQLRSTVKQSNVSVDQLLGPGNCGNAKPGGETGAIQDGRCGHGSPLPLLVISPEAKRNYADNRVTDPFSILRL